MALSDNFTVTDSKCRFDGSTTSLAENDDSEASDSVLQIGHLVGSNRGQLELHRKSSKM